MRHLRRWTLEPSALPRPLGPNDPPESRQPGQRGHRDPLGQAMPSASATRWVSGSWVIEAHPVGRGAEPRGSGDSDPVGHHRATQRVKRGHCDNWPFRAGEAQDLILSQWVIYFHFSRIDPLNQKGTLSPLTQMFTQRVGKAPRIFLWFTY